MGGSPQDCAAPHRPPAEQLMHPPLARFGHVGLLRRAPFEHLVDAQLVQRFLVLLRDRPAALLFAAPQQHHFHRQLIRHQLDTALDIAEVVLRRHFDIQPHRQLAGIVGKLLQLPFDFGQIAFDQLHGLELRDR